MERLPDFSTVVTKLRSLRSESQKGTFRRNETFLLMFLAGLLGFAIHFHLRTVVLFLVFPLVFYGLMRPTEILVIAIVMSPLTTGLTGDNYDHVRVIFSISDVLYLFVLPYVVWRVRCEPSLLKLNGLGLPALLYLSSGLISFALNLGFMHGSRVPYFSAWLRSAQIIFIVPLMFSATRWKSGILRYWMLGYLAISSLLAMVGGFRFIFIDRDHHYYAMGFQKNIVGLTLMVAVLISLAGIIRSKSPGQPESADVTDPRIARLERLRPWLIGFAILCFFGLAITLSRGSYIAVAVGTLVLCGVQRRPLLFLCLLFGGILVIAGVQKTLPRQGANYLTDLSPKSSSLSPRVTMVTQAKQAVHASPLFGDGYRMRRDNVPHNLEATILVETGVVGAFFFLWTLLTLFRLMWVGRKTVPFDPVFQWFTLALFSCAVAILVHAQFDPFWRRGPLWTIWAGGGVIISYLREVGQHISSSEGETR